ncbi:MAG: helix-hairpin-helix domain-containing protein [Methylococcales symbiont of Iophon sp. n. MRB-2018]|nr:MAG: helix-hairpin-helix domain-containing protein [Methylococcales symbiont of Iophon sp. n. MRB-2018]KAF3979849.1 MAG: helix-hairpin-helix domain-containing protein [Methylococcales symbiont of Iophon sp. n. MRB-2018]
MKKLIILLAILSFNVTAKPVNINSADATTLSESLSGIGQKKAEAIVQYRMDNGEFESLSDLTNVKGIGEKTVEKNADDILFSDPEAVEKPKKGKKKK